MPRPKTKADEVYNARRRLKRAAERARREGIDESVARQLEGQARALRGRVTEDKLRVARHVSNLKEIKFTSKTGKPKAMGSLLRRRAIFKQNINTAGTKASDYSTYERDLFFASTRGIWTGRDKVTGELIPGVDTPNDRIERILRYMYTSDAADAQAFRQWLTDNNYSANKRDIDLVFDYVTNVANAELMAEQPESYDGGTPKGLVKVVEFG